MYNPTFQEELRAWGDGCAARAQRDLLHTARLIVALHWAACARVPFGKWLLAHDTPEAILQLYQTRFRFAGPKPQFVTYLGNYMSNLHRLGDATIFVTHSQGNMMVSQALANLSAFEATQGACVAELTLASPIGRTHFKVNGVQLNDAFLDGVSVRGDVLQLLVPDTDNDFTPFIDTDISMQAEQAFQTITGVFELERARWDWGIRIHEVNHNYFDYSSSRTVLIHKLQNLYDNCQTAWSR